MPTKHFVDEILYVTIKEVKPYAAFFVTDDNQNGMVHISEISDNFIKDISKFFVKGDVIKIKILQIDEKDGFIRGSYKRIKDEEKFSSHIDLRYALDSDKADFEPLANKIPQWIDETIKRKGLKK